MTSLPLTKRGPEAGGNFEYHWAGKYLEAHFLSDVGKKRGHNEDSCLLCAPDDQNIAEARGFLFSVADGMGGASAGEYASRLALQTLCERYYESTFSLAPERLREALLAANRAVYEEAEHNPDYYGMGTTVSAVLVRGGCAYVAQVGDSRVYVARNRHTLHQITDDHSLVAEQVRNGFLTEEEARNHALKNLITRAVGIKEELKVDLFTFRLKAGDTLLVCSDGLTNLVSDGEISEEMRDLNLQGAARRLVGKALEGGGPDNISVALIRVTAPPPRCAPDEGAEEVVLPKPGFLGKFRRFVFSF